jgi:cell division protein FtsZ
MSALQPSPENPQAIIRDDVVLTPTQAKQATAYEPHPLPEVAVEEGSAPGAPFLPPQADRTVRPTRMPRVEELPMPAQNQIRASRGEAEAGPAAQENKRMTLLQRLATVGFGGRKDDAPSAAVPVESAPIPNPAPRPAVAAEASARAPVPPVHAEYVKRPAHQPQLGYRPVQGSLDAQGRVASPSRTTEDDQLEIPAFLRRQSS